MNLVHNKSEIERRVHAVIDKFAERGLRSLAVAYQVMSSHIVISSSYCSSIEHIISLLFKRLLVLFHILTIYYPQEVPDGRKESQGGPWQFIGLMPLFDPPRHDSAETIRRALNLGVNVKMITGVIPFHMISLLFCGWMLGQFLASFV